VHSGLLPSPVMQFTGVSKTYPDSPVPAVNDVSFRVRPGEIVSILGPSGCGKTTLLRLIAGFESPEAGQISIGGKVATDASKGLFVRPAQRRVGFVFQDDALFPHLNVLQNVMFGLNGRSKAARKERAMSVLDLVGMRVFAERAPHQLSGGQQQRVALARALAPQPQIVLLDEPFSSLDAALRTTTRDEIRRILRSTGTTALLVTHDQDEAMSFGDRLIVMRAGSIEQQGSPEEVYNRPATTFSALFVGGSNLVRGTGSGAVASTPLGDVSLSQAATGPVLLSVRPENIEVRLDGEGGVPARVTERTFRGNHLALTCVTSGVDEQKVQVLCGADLACQAGDTVRLRVRGLAVPISAQRPGL